MKADGFNVPYETHMRSVEHPCTTLFVGSNASEIAYDIIREHLKDYGFNEETDETDNRKVFTLVLNGNEDSKNEPSYFTNPHITVATYASLDDLKELENRVGIPYHEINFNSIEIVGNEIDLGLLSESELINVKPKNKYQLLKICGMIHGINVWTDNGEHLIPNGIVDLSHFPAFREDIFKLVAPELEKHGFDKEYAYTITKFARTGKFSRQDVPENIMKILDTINLPSWFTGYLNKVQYMFSKSHGIELCRLGLATSFYKSKLK